MRPALLTWGPLAVLAALISSCGDGETPPIPPQTTAHRVMESVQLVSTLTDEVGQVTGTETIDDASGIRIYCRHGDAVPDSAFTVAGQFTFAAVSAGSCTVYAAVATAEQMAEVRFEMPSHDHTVMESLELRPVGDLRIYPNPPPDEGAGVEFTTHSDQTYRVSVQNLRGDTVWSYSQAVPPGYYHVHWAGKDQEGHEVEAGPYWVVVELDDQATYGLVLWGHEHDSPNPGHCGHIEASGLIVAHHDERLVTCWEGSRSGDLSVGVGQETHNLQVIFLGADSTTFAVADSCPDNRLTWTLADSSVAALRFLPGKKWEFRAVGMRAGTTDVTFHAWHLNHVHFSSPPIPILVAPAAVMR